MGQYKHPCSSWTQIFIKLDTEHLQSHGDLSFEDNWKVCLMWEWLIAKPSTSKTAVLTMGYSDSYVIVTLYFMLSTLTSLMKVDH